MTRSDVSQYLMKEAFKLSLFFIVEYWLSLYAFSHLWLAGVVLLLKIVTPVALYYILRELRRTLPAEAPFPGLIAWSLGVRVMLFAALPEAAFIYVYNQFVDPEALHGIAQMMIAQLENLQQAVGSDVLADATIDLYREAQTPTAIEAAINMLSQDVMAGIFLMLIIAPILRRKGQVPPMPQQ